MKRRRRRLAPPLQLALVEVCRSCCPSALYPLMIFACCSCCVAKQKLSWLVLKAYVAQRMPDRNPAGQWLNCASSCWGMQRRSLRSSLHRRQNSARCGAEVLRVCPAAKRKRYGDDEEDEEEAGEEDDEEEEEEEEDDE